MSKIDDMIKQLCPNGVESVRLGDVCVFVRGKTITQNETINGDVPVIAGGQKPSYFHNKHNRCGESVTVAGSGAYAGFVSYWNNPIWVSDAFTVEPSENCLHKYIYYFLKQNQQILYNSKKGAGVPHVHGKDIARIEIPLPPLPIQEEIVRILDKFTILIEKLDEAIALRQKQFEYYREKLLTFKDGECEWKTLGDVCDIKNGKDYKDLNSGNIPVWGTGGVMTYVDTYAYDQPSVLLPRKGSISKVYYTEGPIWTVDTLFYTEVDTKMIAVKFLFSYLSCLRLEKYNTSVGNRPSLTKTVLNTIPIPIPSLARQQEIVSTLDKFEALIAKLKEARDLRQKQYEYYREKLLTF